MAKKIALLSQMVHEYKHTHTLPAHTLRWVTVMGGQLATLEYKSHFPSASAPTPDLQCDVVFKKMYTCESVCVRGSVDSHRIPAPLHYIILTSVH